MIFLASALLAVSPAAGPAKDKLHGTWVVTDDGGENPVRPGGHARGTRWVFDNGALTFSDDPKDGEGRFYKADGKTIEVTITPRKAGFGPALINQYGLHEVDGDRLKIYFASPGREQPKAFPKEGGPEQFRVLTLERVKK
jgi:hypothetical protein